MMMGPFDFEGNPEGQASRADYVYDLIFVAKSSGVNIETALE